jgi:SAM-dependent methyltransferase
MKSNGQHWDRIFAGTRDEKLGWYENDPSKTLELLSGLPTLSGLTVFLPGAGTSVLVETLLERGAGLVLNDISAEALNKVRERLGKKAGDVTWLCQDIARPVPPSLPAIDLWIDRAVLHFLTEEEDISGYMDNLRTLLRPGGRALFAEFSMDGAVECAGLTLHRYSAGELTARLGAGFTLLNHFDHVYTNPFGEPRPYVYALFARAPTA